MYSNFWLFATISCLSVAHLATADTRDSRFVQFHPITRKQYNSLLRVTADKPVISEARLIHSGIPNLESLRSSISDELSSRWKIVLDRTGLATTTTKKPHSNKVKGYPLCVIKTTTYEEDGSPKPVGRHFDGNHGEARSPGISYRPEYVPENDDDDLDRPIVNCVVVVKSDKDPTIENNSHPPRTIHLKDKRHRHDYNYYPNYPAAAYNPYAYPYDPYHYGNEENYPYETRDTSLRKHGSRGTTNPRYYHAPTWRNAEQDEQEQVDPTYPSAFDTQYPYQHYN